MEIKIESLIEQLNVHRKNLSDLEIKKAEYGLDIPLHVKREYEHEEVEIRRIEAEIWKSSNKLNIKVNEIRALIITTVNEYIQLLSQVGEFENLFLTYVLFPGTQLQLTIQKRKYLEKEYNQIRNAIERGAYLNPQEIEADIKKTLKHAEIAYAYNDKEQPDENLKSMSPTKSIEMLEEDIPANENEKSELIREFKHIVLPKVHSDTSDAPYEVFNVVYDAYKKQDYLLMKVFIIQYRGEVHPSDTEEPLTFINIVKKYHQEYQLVLEKIEKRLEKLKKDDIIKRMDNMEDIQTQMKKQNREIRKAIYDEAEQVLHFRSCLEDLLTTTLKSKGGD